MSLQITPGGVTLPSAAEYAELSRSYADGSCVRLPRLLHPAILRRLQARLRNDTAWQPNVHNLVTGIATEFVFADPVTIGLLTAMFHDRVLFGAVMAITGCDPIRSCHGRIYRMDPRTHEDVWHTDVNGKYLVAFSVNLTDGQFRGGELHLRDYHSKRMQAQMANTGPGDAILFRIDAGLEHIVTPVTGTVPKIAWAGWFHRDPLMPELDRLAGLGAAW